MFIHEMSTGECNDVLSRAKFGRLACACANQPYVVPINFTYDGASYLYGFTTLGQKVEWMRANPLVCFEVDEVTNHNHWFSVIVFGRYEELPDKPEFEAIRAHAHEFLQKRAMWWEPAYLSQEHRDNPHSLTPIFFRIRIEKITGHRANSDDTETAMTTVISLPVRQTKIQTPKSAWKQILKAAVLYFLIVFGAGTLLGPIRILFVTPHLGERNAELLEAPVMLLVIIVASKWVVRKFQLPMRPVYRVGMGVIGFILGLLFEFGLVLQLRDLKLSDYFASRDPVAAGVYYVTLVLFALMPLLVRRKRMLK